MDEDRLYGTAKNIGGKVQEGFGRATGDTETQARGVVNQAAGAAQDLYGQAKDAAADAADSMFHGATTAQDYLRQFIENRPYTTAVLALSLGWLIGRGGQRD